MMNMFYPGSHMGFGFINLIFSLSFLIGLVLFIVWLVQTLNKKKQLLGWAIGLIVVGLLGGLLMFRFTGFGGYGMMYGLDKNSYDYMIEHMTDDEHTEISNPDELREHMVDEMEEMMGY